MLHLTLSLFRLIGSLCDHCNFPPSGYSLPGINPYDIALYPICPAGVNSFFRRSSRVYEKITSHNTTACIQSGNYYSLGAIFILSKNFRQRRAALSYVGQLAKRRHIYLKFTLFLYRCFHFACFLGCKLLCGKLLVLSIVRFVDDFQLLSFFLVMLNAGDGNYSVFI